MVDRVSRPVAFKDYRIGTFTAINGVITCAPAQRIVAIATDNSVIT